jgi:hypothetical protein
MTDIDEQDLQPKPVIVSPGKDTRLEQLHASYADAKARADEAATQLKVITDAIKSEIQTQTPGVQRFELRSQVGPPLALTYVESWRLDSKRLKAEHPLVYVTYAKKSSSWTLRAISAGGGEDE